MDGNVELLNYIHQNAAMGADTISHLIEIAQDIEFRKVLESQYREYKEILSVSNDKLRAIHQEPKSINTLSKASAHLMIDLKTLKARDASHLSEMLIQGSTMGIIDMTKKIHAYSDGDEDILNLARRLLSFEEKNVEACKKFLN